VVLEVSRETGPEPHYDVQSELMGVVWNRVSSDEAVEA
jgi:hypothetical protein